MAMSEPYYKSSTQRLWRFPNGYGASVVKVHDDSHEVAPIRFTDTAPTDVPDGLSRWYIDYQSPFGRPKSGLSDADALKHVETISQFEAPKE